MNNWFLTLIKQDKEKVTLKLDFYLDNYWEDSFTVEMTITDFEKYISHEKDNLIAKIDIKDFEKYILYGKESFKKLVNKENIYGN